MRTILASAAYSVGKGGLGMEGQDQAQLEQALGELDQSGQFLVAILAGLLLSLRALLAQREQLCLTLAGEQPPPLCLYPLRHAAGSLTLGGLGFFLCQALRTRARADPADPVAVSSACSGLTAAVLVFLAAAIRLADTNFLHRAGRL